MIFATVWTTSAMKCFLLTCLRDTSLVHRLALNDDTTAGANAGERTLIDVTEY